MATGVDPEHISCTACGRKFRYKIELAGRTVKCPCGTAIMVPKPAPAPAAAAGGDPEDPFANVDWGGYDVADEPATPAKPASKPVVAPAVGLAAPAGAADTPVPADASASAAAPTVRTNLPPRRKGLQQEERKTNEDLVPPSVLRDFILPSILIAVGIYLSFYAVMSDQATRTPLVFGDALGVVAIKVGLSVALMLGGMFLAINMFGVSFVGSLPRTAFKLIGVAIGPSAIYSILSHAGGEEYGAILGTFASVAAYALLFWLIMRLDIQDTAVCVTMTWIFVSVANYVAYKVEGMMKDSWI